MDIVVGAIDVGNLGQDREDRLLDAQYLGVEVIRHPLAHGADQRFQIALQLGNGKLMAQGEFIVRVAWRHHQANGIETHHNQKPERLNEAGEKEQQPHNAQRCADNVGGAVEKEPELCTVHG